MKITNFHDYVEKRTKPYGYRIAKAKITITTTKWLFWTHSEVREIYLAENTRYWRFLDTGEYTPGSQVEALHTAYEFNKEFNAPVV